MGILIGTCLAVVLPEGVETVVEAKKDSVLATVGASLLLGFVVMFLVDHFSVLAEMLGWKPDESRKVSGTLTEHIVSIGRSTLTLGLILHSFVDGIALGTSFFHGNGSFPIFFFVMIIVHKLPTAFSLVVVLHQEGLAFDVINLHLIVFSLASPLASVFAYFVILLLKLDSPLTVGILLLFSAGTFLYSVMHVMTEILDKHEYAPVEPDQPTQEAKLSSVELLLAVAGMLLPIVFTLTETH